MFAKRKHRREPILDCHVRDLLSLLDEDRVRGHDDGVGFLLLHFEETAADILDRRCLDRQAYRPDSLQRDLKIDRVRGIRRVFRIHKYSHARHLWCNAQQHLHNLWTDVGTEVRKSSGVTAGPPKACYKSAANRVVGSWHHNGNCCGRFLPRANSRRSCRYDRFYFQFHHFRSWRREAPHLIFSKPPLDHQVPAFDIAEVAHASNERAESAVLKRLRALRQRQESNAPSAVLCNRVIPRQDGRQAHRPQHYPSIYHSITLSARSTSPAGIS